MADTNWKNKPWLRCQLKKILVLLIGIIIIANPILSFERHDALFFYGQRRAYIDSQPIDLDAPPIIINGQVMISLDLMAQLTKTKVNYGRNYFTLDHTSRDKPVVYFNRDFNGDTTQPNKRLDRLLGFINKAKVSIWVQMFSFTYAPVVNALVEAKKRNVDIYCLFDNTEGNVEHAQDLVDAGINIKYDWRGGVQFHRKLAVFDETTVLIGSTNWSEQGFERNSEVDLSVDDPELASEILIQMDKDWKMAKEIDTGKPDPIPPGTESPYIGNKKTKVYHKASCSSVADMSPENKEPLKTRQEAESKNYNPCGRCKPDKS